MIIYLSRNPRDKVNHIREVSVLELRTGFQPALGNRGKIPFRPPTQHGRNDRAGVQWKNPVHAQTREQMPQTVDLQLHTNSM